MTETTLPQRIFAASDLSARCDRSLARAALLARARHSELTVAHVVNAAEVAGARPSLERRAVVVSTGVLVTDARAGPARRHGNGRYGRDVKARAAFTGSQRVGKGTARQHGREPPSHAGLRRAGRARWLNPASRKDTTLCLVHTRRATE